MNKILKILVFVLVVFLIGTNSFTQDFGFGFSDDDFNNEGFSDFESGGAENTSLLPKGFKLLGKTEAAVFSFLTEGEESYYLEGFIPPVSDFTGVLADGSLGLEYSGASVDGKFIFDFNLFPEYSFALNEAWIQSFFGPIDVKVGYLKHNWGKADSEGPLDVINPVDLSNLSELDQNKQKISQAALVLGWAITPFTRLELAATPFFQADVLPMAGRWQANQIKSMVPLLTGPFVESYSITQASENDYITYPQAGFRLTGTLFSQDLGIQYWYGNMRSPSMEVKIDYLYFDPFDPLATKTEIIVNIDYDRYHLIGVDWASVLFTLNIRSEIAILLTEDLKGDDPAVTNPQFKWVFGFDRDLFAGINLNLQAGGLVRLKYDNIGTETTDFEKDINQTETRLTARLSKGFFRDELEINLIGIWGIEDKDFYLLPEINFLTGSLSTKIVVGFFLGDKEGNLGQYYKNNWLKISLVYNLE